MEINKCMGCMSEFRGYPCPNCGFAPENLKGAEYSLPMETILGGKYLVGRVLGQGGFGITYIGWDIALERKVAIKEYYPSGQVSRAPGTRALTWYTSPNAQQARQDGMQMFLKEARKMVKVDSIPNVVRVLDLFQENETAYIVMDFVEGKTLKSILQTSGPMPWAQAKEIFLPAIRAMESVHAAGLVHRDLSPDNLMITPDGKVKILDLGAAKDLNINSGASSMQVAKGGFSPFEQYTQRGGSGPWTDVYAMAATIYYTLTGKLPPVATDRVDEDTIHWDYPGLLALPAPALEALQKAMIIQSKKRTQSMAELETGLLAVVVKPEPPKPQPSVPSKPLADLINHPIPQHIAAVIAPRQKEPKAHPMADPYRPPRPQITDQSGKRSLADLINNPNFVSSVEPKPEPEPAVDRTSDPLPPKKMLALAAVSVLISCLPFALFLLSDSYTDWFLYCVTKRSLILVTLDILTLLAAAAVPPVISRKALPAPLERTKLIIIFLISLAVVDICFFLSWLMVIPYDYYKFLDGYAGYYVGPAGGQYRESILHILIFLPLHILWGVLFSREVFHWKKYSVLLTLVMGIAWNAMNVGMTGEVHAYKYGMIFASVSMVSASVTALYQIRAKK